MFHSLDELVTARVVAIAYWLVLVIAVCKPFAVADCNQDCQKQCVDVVNKYRSNHGAPAVENSLNLTKQAQAWADRGILGTSEWAKSKGGECWAWGLIYPHWKAVVKAWHDEEAHFDWSTMMTSNGQSTGCFSQVVWKRATKIGCAKASREGQPFYVMQMDRAGVIDESLAGYEASNIGRPIKPDLAWFQDEVPHYTINPGGFIILSEPEVLRFPQYFGKYQPKQTEPEMEIVPKYPGKHPGGPTSTRTITYIKTGKLLSWRPTPKAPTKQPGYTVSHRMSTVSDLFGKAMAKWKDSR